MIDTEKIKEHIFSSLTVKRLIDTFPLNEVFGREKRNLDQRFKLLKELLWKTLTIPVTVRTTTFKLFPTADGL